MDGASFKDEITTYLDLDCEDVPLSIWRKAERELGETDAKRIQCLNEIKELIKGEPDLKCDTSNNFLLKFLRVRKFRAHSAFNLLKSYYKHRQKYPSLYQDYTPEHHRNVMDENMITFLPKRTQDGSAIYALKIGLWNTQKIRFEEILKFGLLCNEKALEYPVTQISGIVTVVDVKDLSWSHLFSSPLTKLRCFVSAAQDCFPIRHRAIHIVNNKSIFGILFSIMKPLIKQEIRERIYFHGNDLNALHRHIPRHILPVDFGGTQEKFVNEVFYKSLLDSEECFIKSLTYGYDIDER